ncbi:MAG TPA: hypothetical protein VI072_32875 [Polyangiaceae bacterium]
MDSALDPFIPHPDVRERFVSTIRAPAGVVMKAAAAIDLQSLPAVRAIFWLRERLMGAARGPVRKPQGLLAEMRGLGWGVLVEEADRVLVCGAASQPWVPNPRFTPIEAERFVSYAEPNRVKIAWSLEAERIGPALTRFVHETRVVATDAEARARFNRYWRWARFGIVTIRLLLMPAIRRAAERQWSVEART